MDFIAENKFEAMKKLSFKYAPGTLMKDLLTAVVREDKKTKIDGDSEGELTMMHISGELRQKTHLKRLNVDLPREMLIESLEKKQRKS
jgi:hypothetical protein